jgi:hypothetical protein
MTHDMVECCNYENDSSLNDKSAKPFDSSKKPWQKKPSSGGNQMVYLTKKVGKLERQLKKARSKNLAKKQALGLLDNDYDSDKNSWSSGPGIHIEKNILN